MQLVDVRDSQKRTPLMLAVQNDNEGRKACTDILLSYTSQVDLFDNNGRTALHYASCRGFEDCVSSLLDAKASPYQKDFLGKTPFHLAAAMGHLYVLKQLIQQGDDSLVDVKLLDHQSYTPLHWAAYKGEESFLVFSHFFISLFLIHLSDSIWSLKPFIYYCPLSVCLNNNCPSVVC